MEVLDQLAANPVATTTPGVQEGAGVQTLTTAEEDSLSRRSEVIVGSKYMCNFVIDYCYTKLDLDSALQCL